MGEERLDVLERLGLGEFGEHVLEVGPRFDVVGLGGFVRDFVDNSDSLCDSLRLACCFSVSAAAFFVVSYWT